jgi:hypothetical protein
MSSMPEDPEPTDRSLSDPGELHVSTCQTSAKNAASDGTIESSFLSTANVSGLCLPNLHHAFLLVHVHPYRDPSPTADPSRTAGTVPYKCHGVVILLSGGRDLASGPHRG